MFAVPLAAVGAEMGYHPIHFGVWFIIVTLYGAVTPPVGTILYVAMSIANAKVDEVVGLLVPYMAVLILVAILVLFIPELTLWLPRFVGLL
jgi:C4-dicarboxylate transporter DctM subunit